MYFSIYLILKISYELFTLLYGIILLSQQMNQSYFLYKIKSYLEQQQKKIQTTSYILSQNQRYIENQCIIIARFTNNPVDLLVKNNKLNLKRIQKDQTGKNIYIQVLNQFFYVLLNRKNSLNNQYLSMQKHLEISIILQVQKFRSYIIWKQINYLGNHSKKSNIKTIQQIQNLQKQQVEQNEQKITLNHQNKIYSAYQQKRDINNQITILQKLNRANDIENQHLEGNKIRKSFNIGKQTIVGINKLLLN